MTKSKSYLKLVNLLKKEGVNFNARQSRSIHKRLEEIGCEYISEGCYKFVYYHPLYPDWVIKTFISNSNRDCEIENLPEELKPFYVYPVFEEGKISIQRKIKIDPKAGLKLQKMFPKLDLISKLDIGGDNTGFINKKPYFIDFLIAEIQPW